MTRITILFLLVTFWSSAALAAVYQCRDKDGNLFLTNKREKFPPGCVQVGEPIGEEGAPSTPAAPPPSARGSGRDRIERGRSSSPPRPTTPPGPREETTPGPPSPAAGATPGQPGEQQQQEVQAEERREEVPPVSGQADQPNVDTAVEGGEKPAEVESGAARAGELERLRGEARALAARYDALQNAAGTEAEKAAQLEQLESSILQFLDRLAASRLSPEERVEVEAELPPE